MKFSEIKDYVLTPGAHLAKEMRDWGWSIAYVAEKSGLGYKVVDDLLHDRISYDSYIDGVMVVEYLFKVTPMWNYGWFADEEVRFNKKSADPFVLIYRYEDIMFPNPDSAILDDLEAEVEAVKNKSDQMVTELEQIETTVKSLLSEFDVVGCFREGYVDAENKAQSAILSTLVSYSPLFRDFDGFEERAKFIEDSLIYRRGSTLKLAHIVFRIISALSLLIKKFDQSELAKLLRKNETAK